MASHEQRSTRCSAHRFATRVTALFCGTSEKLTSWSRGASPKAAATSTRGPSPTLHGPALHQHHRPFWDADVGVPAALQCPTPPPPGRLPEVPPLARCAMLSPSHAGRASWVGLSWRRRRRTSPRTSLRTSPRRRRRRRRSRSRGRSPPRTRTRRARRRRGLSARCAPRRRWRLARPTGCARPFAASWGTSTLGRRSCSTTSDAQTCRMARRAASRNRSAPPSSQTRRSATGWARCWRRTRWPSACPACSSSTRPDTSPSPTSARVAPRSATSPSW
mmetsp:Transcript_10865/g.34459  ORF Transcript_10865/g.34459 Transcript_10865/m.34459 type:complete len:276 (+) Transcript_10865:3-830(+)